ncbi:YesL family protein [Microbacterium sp. AK031]|uniref:YesL family protein n=1 Tax=Microbacterium sp. AK031 TaxID=2723076 RepID=UPI002167617E|nr:YesL family protein [Microbacterium sp. AK031]MCS3841787.1 putative membrane protein YesL [Microbacterium sp. AK031]
MRIDPENRTLQGMTAFLGLIALNVIYLLMCLPIVTAGAATSALYEVMIRYSDDESGRPLKDYFPAFGRNFLRATALWIALLVPFLLLVIGALFWSGHPNVLAGAAMVLAMIAAAYVFATFLYAMALTAVYRNTFRQTLKNALLLPLAEPVRTMGIVLIPIAVVCITIAVPVFGIIIATIGCSVGAYISAFLFRKVFERRQAI